MQSTDYPVMFKPSALQFIKDILLQHASMIIRHP